MNDVKEMVLNKIVHTLFLIFLTLCNFLVILSIIVFVWAIGYICSVLGINAYTIDVLQMVSGIGLICIFITYTLADMVLAYKICFKL